MDRREAWLKALRDKRDGRAVDEATMEAVAGGIASGDMPDSQVAAFAMAVCVNGMDAAETAALTRVMAESGEVMSWDEGDLGGPVADKHSTGGVGDKVSLLLAPIVAACGAFVPMVSGRSLGHTGGTVDKLESIPGYRTDLSADELREAVRKAGCAIVGATADLAPADRRLYSIRDVTSTVESVPLITASILSKKKAAGVTRLTMDVKTGSGAFMREFDAARELAVSLARTAEKIGIKCVSLVTDMSQPIGDTAGNSLEVAEVVDILTGRIEGDSRLVDLTLDLASQMLIGCGLADDLEDGVAKARGKIEDGSAADRMGKMAEALGGDPSFMDDPHSSLPRAGTAAEVFPSESGFVTGFDTRELGMAVVSLGGGRLGPGDPIDRGVGLSRVAHIGDEVDPKGRPIAVVHASDKGSAEGVADRIRAAVFVEDRDPPQAEPVVLETVS